jgi:DNA polymerase-3 subunit gamma/tau
MDFVEQDAASHNSVDDIRQLRENVVLTPMAGDRKVYLLDEVHMLTGPAQNALLKTLEEPPPHIIFVLATTEAHKVSGTIISRCQRFDLKRIPMDAAIGRLQDIAKQEGFELDRPSFEEIARAATGSLRDGINALEQVVTYYGKSPSHEQVCEALGLSVDARSGQLARAAMNGDLGLGLTLIAEVRDDGVDIKQFARQVIKYMRGLLLAKAGASESLDLPQDMANEVKADAANLPRSEIIRALQTFGRIDFREDAAASGGSLPLELALVEFVSTTTDAPAGVVRERPAPVAATTVSAAPTTANATPNLPSPSQGRGAGGEGPATPRAATPAPKTNGNAAPKPTATEPPTPEPVAASAKSPDSDDLLTKTRKLLHETDKTLEGLLNGSCEIKSSDGDTVVLGFFHTFHLERIESNSYKEKLQNAFSTVLGRPVKVTYEHSPQGRPSEKRAGGHLVQAAREMGAKSAAPEAQP